MTRSKTQSKILWSRTTLILLCFVLLSVDTCQSVADVTLVDLSIVHSHGYTDESQPSANSSVSKTYSSTSPLEVFQLIGDGNYASDNLPRWTTDQSVWSTEAVANNQGSFYNRSVLDGGLNFELGGTPFNSNRLQPNASVYYDPSDRSLTSNTSYTAKFGAATLDSDFAAKFHVSETTLAVTQVQSFNNAAASAGFAISVGPNINELTTIATGHRSLEANGVVFTSVNVPDGVPTPNLNAATQDLAIPYASLPGFEDVASTHIKRFAPFEITLPISPTVLSDNGEFVVRYFEYADARSSNQGGQIETTREIDPLVSVPDPGGSLSASGFPFQLHAYSETGDPFTVSGNSGGGSSATPFVDLINVTAVPEPRQWLLLCFVGIGFAGKRRACRYLCRD